MLSISEEGMMRISAIAAVCAMISDYEVAVTVRDDDIKSDILGKDDCYKDHELVMKEMKILGRQTYVDRELVFVTALAVAESDSLTYVAVYEMVYAAVDGRYCPRKVEKAYFEFIEKDQS